MLVVERGDLVFVFNFHPVSSFSDYRVGAYLPGPYKARAATHDSFVEAEGARIPWNPHTQALLVFERSSPGPGFEVRAC